MKDSLTDDLMNELNRFFERRVEIPRTRVGQDQTLETLVNEEALLLAEFLRDESEIWIPRISA